MELLMHLRKGILSAVIPVAFIIAVCPFSRAFADVTPVENDGAINFVHELSSASAIPEGDLVAVMANANSIYTGINWVNPDGSIALKNQLSPNLLSYKKNVLFSSKWEELSSSEQTSWGNQDNYNAANFNSSLDAYGLGDARDRYYSTGGGSFEFTSGEQGILDSLKSVYDDWSSGSGTFIGDVLNLFTEDAQENFDEYIGTSDSVLFDPENNEGMPGEYSINLTTGDWFWYQSPFSSGFQRVNYLTEYNVYFFALSDGSNVYEYTFSKNTYKNGSQQTFSTNRPNITLRNNAILRNGYYYYYLSSSTGWPTHTDKNFEVTEVSSVDSSYVNQLLDYFNGITDLDSEFKPKPDIEGYPEDISQETQKAVYYPTEGIAQDTSWTQYLEAISEDTEDIVTLLKRILTEVKLLDRTSEDLTDLENLVSRFQFYASGQLKVHDEGVFDSLTDIGSDINDILQQLIAWPKGDAADAPDVIGDFDFPELQSRSADLVENISSLAPFGATLLLSQMVAILSQTGNIQKPEMVIDFDFFTGHSYDVVIDLSWLDDGRVYINAFCIIALILCLINVTIRIIEMEAAS